MQLPVLLVVLALVGSKAFCPSKTSPRTLVATNMVSISPWSSSSILQNGGAIALATPKPKPNAFLAGNISLGLKTIVARSGSAYHKVDAAFHLPDLIVILCLSFLPTVIMRFVNNNILNRILRRDNPLEFEDTPILSRASGLLCQAGRLSLFVYSGELFMVFLSELGVPGLNDKPKLFASFVFGVWGARLISKLKDHLLDRALLRYPNRVKLAPRITLYKRILDAAIYLVCTLLFLDANSIDVGVALKSILTLGGVSSVVVGLALKEPMTEIIQGTSVLLSDKFSQGEVIRLSDGTSGTVQDMRWTDVSIRENDNSFVRIPNSQVAKYRIINLSRMPNSQVSQELRLPNRGGAKTQQLLKDIKTEIRADCPKLVDDGSQPFRVHWTDFEKDNIVVTIESNFRIKRLSDEYWDNRQNVLLAVSRAIEKYS